MKPKFNISTFERLVANRRYEDAATELLQLLSILDENYGIWLPYQVMDGGTPLDSGSILRLATRAAAGAATLFSDPQFTLSEVGARRFLALHKWLTTLFAASGFENADHVLRAIDTSADRRLSFDGNALLKFVVLHSLESDLPWKPENIWAGNSRLAASHFMTLCSTYVAVSQRAGAKRESLLRWLPSRLDDVQLDESDMATMQAAWMHCSYAVSSDKHQLKAALNRQFRRILLENGIGDLALPASRPIQQKPVMLVVIEWFSSVHAMYRCYAPSVQALRERFRLHAIAYDGYMDSVAEQLFDEVRYFRKSQPLEVARQAVDYVKSLQPDVIFYPSLGMSLLSVCLANLRLAPIQMMCPGHPATSMSAEIDYLLTEEDVLGDPALCSEQVIALPRNSMTMTSRRDAAPIEPDIRVSASPVRIAVTASPMKLNPEFLDACARIAHMVSVPVEFHFFCLINGVAVCHVEQGIREVLQGAHVHAQTDYGNYIRNLNQCDMYLEPFPFGSANGIVDAVRQCIPGVCLKGAELHSQGGAMFWRRLGLPDWLIASTLDQYIAAAAELANNHPRRLEIIGAMKRGNPDHIFFEGAPKRFAQFVHWLYENHERVKSLRQKVVCLQKDAGSEAGSAA